MSYIRIFDTTLRDGEQSPGCSMNLNEKLKIAQQLALLNVDVIEAGFAVSSPGDFASVKAIADQVRGVTICSLSRALEKDIDASAQALAGAEDPCIHIFLATSDVHMRYKLRMTPDEVLDSISRAVAYARNLAPKVEFSAEDASRSDRDFLCRAFARAVKAGASTINIPDTVGYATPEEMADLVRYVKEHVPNLGDTAISVHCHNDLGMAVANSLSSVKAGATQVECAVNGIGERAGNAALEEVVMAIATRAAQYGQTRINTRQIYRTSSKLARIIGVAIPPNKAIVGANAFAHESGIHQHGVLANRETYEIMSPESVGVVKNSMVLGKHSGRHAFEERLISLGYKLPADVLEDLFHSFKALADKKKDVSDTELEAMVEGRSQTVKHYALDRYVINSGNTIKSTAVIRLTTLKGERIEDVAVGDGPVFASFKAIDKITHMDLALDDYSIRAVTKGEDALGQVAVKVSCGGKSVTGRGLSTDVLESSILAYLHAINKLISLG